MLIHLFPTASISEGSKKLRWDCERSKLFFGLHCLVKLEVIIFNRLVGIILLHFNDWNAFHGLGLSQLIAIPGILAA